MPFTVSHAAAAAPLQWAARRRLILSALIIGTFTPDMEYFIFLETRRTLGHSLPGLIVMDVPIGLVMLFLWHGFLKRPFALLAPASVSTRIHALAREPFAWGPAARFAEIVFALWIGALSHVAWDSFTHWWGYFPRHFPILRETVLVVGSNHIAACRLLQYVSSLFGLAFITWWAARAIRPLPRAPIPETERLSAAYKILAWCAVALLGVWGGIANALESGAPMTWAVWESRFVVRGIVGTISAAMVASLLVAGLVHLRALRRGVRLAGAPAGGDEGRA